MIQQSVKQDRIQDVTENIRGRLIPPTQQHLTQQHLTQQTTAALYRCHNCQVWWGSSQQHTLQDFQVFRMAEPITNEFLWEDYRGWRNASEAETCPDCGEKVTDPEYSLR